MPQRPTSILTTLAVSLLALTLIAPWALGQDPDPITEIRRLAEKGDVDAQFTLGVMYDRGEGVPQDDTEAAAGAAQGELREGVHGGGGAALVRRYGRSSPLIIKSYDK